VIDKYLVGVVVALETGDPLLEVLVHLLILGVSICTMSIAKRRRILILIFSR
jgi:hypothetical protein